MIGNKQKLVVFSFTDPDWRAIRDYVKERVGLSDEDIRRLHPIPSRSNCDREINSARALHIWREATNPHATLAEKYLRGRGLELPEGDCIRFHKRCAFGKERFPALISLIRNIESNEPQAIQRTALTPDGTAVKRDGKTFRMTLGPMAGGAIKVDAVATQNLCIGEGLESTLAGRQLGYAPAWAMLSDGGVAKLPLLARVNHLANFAENDAANQQAVRECGRRWSREGKSVEIIEPCIGSDLNDAILAGRAAR
jgi:putative DNA primase/helicase